MLPREIAGTSDECEANTLSVANVVVRRVQESVELTGTINGRCRFNDGSRPVKVSITILQGSTKDIRLVKTEQTGHACAT